ncbi:hypothetical protein RSAG8_07684, partial [Rhizoctonia solani AG-8 WAC10335]
MPLYMLVPPSKKRGGTATKGLHDYMHKHRKRMQVNSTAPPGSVPFYPVEAPQEFDEKGKELGPDAQVWKTYVREADQVDEELVDGWNKSMDVILIFAALFSAISTAFVIESYKSLKPDPADASSQTLLTISQTLMFIANGSQPSSTLLTSEVETPVFQASAKAICVNVLWFLSLSLSVAVSLISMLAKEWCLEFMAGRTGPAGPQARRRQQRWDGIERWRMKGLIMVLPSLIHLALLLFAVGLCVFLWDDVHFGVAIPVVIVTTLAAGAYFTCTVVPFLYDFCPYGTVLSRLVKQFITVRPQSTRDNFKIDEVTARALNWMIVNCETPRSVDVALQSLAAADENVPANVLEKRHAWAMIKQRLECADVNEQSEQDEKARSLYTRALEVYPLTRKGVDCLDYGHWLHTRTRRLEQLVLGVQATINSLIDEQLLHIDPKDVGTAQILQRCALIGRHYLAEGGIAVPGENYTSYRYAVEVEPERLVDDLVNRLEQYLTGEVGFDLGLYCTFLACFAFVICCNAGRGLTEQSVHVGYVVRLIRGFRLGPRRTEYDFQTYISPNMFLATLTLAIYSDNWVNSKSAPPSDYAPVEKVLEAVWAGLMNTVYSERSAMKRLDTTYLAHGILYLLANPNLYDLTADECQALEKILDQNILHAGLPTKIKSKYYAQYIWNISHNLGIIADVPAYMPQLLRALNFLCHYSPSDDYHLLLTPEIYVFVVKCCRL